MLEAVQEAAVANDEHRDLDTHEAFERLLAEAKPLIQRLQSILEEGRNASASTRTGVEAAVRSQPLLTLALAVAAGFVLGSLRRR